MSRKFIFLLAALFFAERGYAQSDSSSAYHGTEITISAEANVYAKPDIAEFKLSIIARQLKATDAFKTYLTRYDALTSSLQDVVDIAKLLTDNLSVTPSFNYQKVDQVTPDYYQVSSSMSISVQISELNKVLGRIASVDGVTINGVIFQAKNQDSLETKALEEAVKKARDKADAIAELEGLTNLKAKSMNTAYSRPRLPFLGEADRVAAPSSVNPSTVSVSASVTVTYVANSK